MNRRDAFKLFVAGAVSLLGMKGLTEAFSRPKPQFIGAATLDVPGPVMGETAHWPQGMELPHVGHLNSRVVAAKINGEWVDTSDWSPEKIRQRLQPRPLRRKHV
jgi:hypothetical protein